ncbi:MAG TPA: DNA polymerase Y family protein [Terriglobales bacterium]|nr:DNA polymerase Y family protein [Terriglobales bacterium]
MFACFYIPDFPVAAVTRTEPDLRTQPLAITEGTPPLVRVIALNEKAREAGVEIGMTESQAEDLLALTLGKIPELSATKLHWASQTPETCYQVRRRSLQQESSAHAALLDCACAFSPRVEATASDTVIADLAGLESLFGPPAKIARDAAQSCSNAGLEVNVGVASNPDAAMHAARGFSGITLIAAGEEGERLGALPIEILLMPNNPVLPNPGVEPGDVKPVKGTHARTNKDRTEEKTSQELLDTFDRWGVRNFRALAILPEIALVERLGERGLHLQRLARGTTSRPLVPAELPLHFEEFCDLEYPIDLLEPLAFVLSRMTEQLCARLSARALSTHQLSLRLELDPDVTIDREGLPIEEPSPAIVTWEQTSPSVQAERSSASQHSPARECRDPGALESESRQGRHTNVHPDEHSNKEASLHPPKFHHCLLRLPVPMLDAKVFLKLLQLELKSHPPQAPVLKIWLTAEPTKPRTAQQGLFLPLTPPPEKLELTLARLGRISGDMENVGSPEVLDTHRRDAFVMQRFAPPAPDFEKCVQTNTSEHPLVAMRLFRPPIPASVEQNGGKPMRISILPANSKMVPLLSGPLAWCAGPWYNSGEWWNHDRWEREEWDIAVASSQQHSSQLARVHDIALYRIYRDLLSGHWFVEGEYD